jgi:hypothetical protein
VTGHIESLLGAASLLTTVNALLYSLWYPEIRAAIDVEKKIHRPDRNPAISIVHRSVLTNAVPLLLATLLQLIVFGPDAIAVISNAVRLTGSSQSNPTSY